MPALRVVDDEVGVEAGSDDALAGAQPEDLGRGRRGHLDPALAAVAALDDALEHEVDALLDPRQPVGDLAESPLPSSFWPWKSKGQWSVPTHWRSSRTRPRQRSSWWSAGRSGGEQTNLAPSKPLPMSSSERKRYWGHVSRIRHGTAIATAHDLFEGVTGGEMHDVDRYVGGLGEADDAIDALALEDRVARDAVEVGVGQAAFGVGCGDDVDGHAVFGVHEDEAAVLGRLAHGPEDGAIVGQEDAGVGREELEVGDALRDEGVHLPKSGVIDVAPAPLVQKSSPLVLSTASCSEHDPSLLISVWRSIDRPDVAHGRLVSSFSYCLVRMYVRMSV